MLFLTNASDKKRLHQFVFIATPGPNADRTITMTQTLAQPYVLTQIDAIAK